MPIIYLSPSTQEPNTVCPCGQATPVGLEGGGGAQGRHHGHLRLLWRIRWKTLA